MTTVNASYRRCRRLNFRFGSTYFWAASVLAPAQRRHVHALYAFCRYADDIVDGAAFHGNRQRALNEFGNLFFEDLTRGHSNDPVLAAVVATVVQLEIDPECFRRFLNSMHMDFTKSTYDTFEDLMLYMDGSAAVIGEMMLPVLEPSSSCAVEPARKLGIAFQLTNFWRDIAEDLDRGRVYLPQSTLQRFDANPYARHVTPEWRDALRYEIERARGIYREADVGLDYLSGRSRECVSAASRLYSGILDRIEANDYDVFSQRARVSYWNKIAVLPAVALPRFAGSH